MNLTSTPSARRQLDGVADLVKSYRVRLTLVGLRTVGYPSRAYVWVMARKPEMPRSVLDDIKKRLVTDHQYPEGLPDLVEVPQSWGPRLNRPIRLEAPRHRRLPEVMALRTNLRTGERGKGLVPTRRPSLR